MAKYQIRDLQKVLKNEQINLKAPQEAAGIAHGAKKGETASNSEKGRLNLRPLNYKNEQLWQKQRDRHIDGIRSKLPAAEFHLVPESRILRPATGKLIQVVKVALCGLLIVIAFNLLNVLAAGLQFKSVLISSASTGFGNLVTGVKETQKLSLNRAENQFSTAQSNFESVLEKISFLKTSSVFAGEKNTDSLKSLLEAGKEISESGQLFSQSAQNLMAWPDLFVQTNRDLAINGQSSSAAASQNTAGNQTEGNLSHPSSLTDSLKQDLQNVQLAIDKLAAASDSLHNVDASILPSPYREALPAMQSNLDNLLAFLNDLSDNFPAVLKLLGDRYPERYLILLQNDTESRPTGGFIGSLLIVDVNDGVIDQADFHDVYQYDGQLNEPIDAPEDIAMITKEWRLRDSNYSPDFALSAEKAAWFLQKSNGPSVDTVIAVNQSAIADLLAALGPVKVTGLKSELNSSNFQFILSYLVETKSYGSNNPKEILKKTIEAFKDKLLAGADSRVLLQALAKAVYDQKILFYSRDEDIQAMFEKMHLTPHQIAVGPDEDYLQVLATSIGGNKSDIYVSQSLTHTTFIDPAGNIADELAVTRRHNWDGTELFRWEKMLDQFGFGAMSENFQDLLGKGINKSSIKVYVPLGAQLENAVGIDPADVLTRHDAELQKTYFLFQMSVAPGEEKTVTLRYSLPHPLQLFPAALYSFTAQKQISLFTTDLKKVLNIAPALTLLRNSQAGLEYSTKMQNDYRMQAVVVN